MAVTSREDLFLLTFLPPRPTPSTRRIDRTLPAPDIGRIDPIVHIQLAIRIQCKRELVPVLQLILMFILILIREVRPRHIPHAVRIHGATAPSAFIPGTDHKIVAGVVLMGLGRFSDLVAADTAVRYVEEGDFDTGGVFGIVELDMCPKRAVQAFGSILVGRVHDEGAESVAEFPGGSSDDVVCS